MNSSAERGIWRPATKLNIYWREMRLAREGQSVETAKVWIVIGQRYFCVCRDVSRLELREDPLHFEPCLLLTYSFFR